LPVHSAPLQMIVTETAPVLVKQLVAHADRHLSLKQAATGGLIIGGGWTASYDDKRRFNTTLRQSVEGNLWVAQRVLPQMQGLRVLRTWAAMNINIDGAPILGEAPNVKGFYNAVTSNGYTLSPVVARMTVDLLQGRPTLFDPLPYSLNRF
jgi:glycine/D-amino acid oxidase-like deaminating enzyme